MNLAWLTDIHLNFLEKEARIKFYDVVVKTGCDRMFISGDIADAPVVASLLKEMSAYIKQPIYFVLGNHDYYRGEVNSVREEMAMLTQSEKLLFWLPSAGPQVLENNTVLLGQDGWGDGRYGDYANSRVMVNDSRLIIDFLQQKVIGKYALLEKMQQLADDDAYQLQANLNEAIDQYHPQKIIVLTHVPPFKEACMHEGKMSNDDFLPYFGSKATGDVLLKIAKANANIEFLVLCGHTHEKASYAPLDNLVIKVGQAEYFKPQVQYLS